MTILCIIGNPADSELDAHLAAAIQHETGGEINWLHQRVALEIHDATATDALMAARDVIGAKRVDAAQVSSAERRKRILIADMDSTMINEECIDELADAVGIKAAVAEITERAMNGELDFEQALRTRVALIKGLERRVMDLT